MLNSPRPPSRARYRRLHAHRSTSVAVDHTSTPLARNCPSSVSNAYPDLTPQSQLGLSDSAACTQSNHAQDAANSSTRRAWALTMIVYAHNSMTVAEKNQARQTAWYSAGAFGFSIAWWTRLAPGIKEA